MDEPPPGEFISQFDKKDVGDITSETDELELGISPYVRYSAEDGAGENGDVHLQIPRYVHAVHYDATNT